MACKYILTLLPVSLILMAGCQTHSIQSDAVRSLVDIEGQKISAAQDNTKAVQSGTTAWIQNEKSAVSDVNSDMELVSAMEATHSLVFSSNQNVASKTGADAQAVAYLIGKIYMADDGGLSQTVLDQFNTDYSTLASISSELSASWNNIASLQNQVAAYSKKSGLGGVDAQLVQAVLNQIPGAAAKFDDLVAKSDQVNTDLQKVMNSGVIPQNNATIQSAASFENDLVNLLDRVKK